jgi:hypothetical protein
VVETFYGSFNTLDHTTMEACVINKAGKSDIDLVTNVFVISRMRQSYDFADGTISPEVWLERGGQPTIQIIFGVSELKLTAVDADDRDGEVSYRVSYRLWGSEPEGEEAVELTAEITPVLPQGTALTDEVRLVRYRDAWRIAEIQREFQ